MRLFIPTIGTPLRLLADWSFTLYDEYRNESVYNPLSSTQKKGWSNDRDSIVVTLPKGTLLTVDRIYIRKGSDDMGGYDSVTFNIRETSHPQLKGVKRMRFWCKLPDVNQMECATEYPKEIVLRGIISTFPKANPEKAIKWLGEHRFEIVKHYAAGNHTDIVVMAPKKRFESVFDSKIKHTKKNGYQWAALQHPDAKEAGEEALKLEGTGIWVRGLPDRLLASVTLQEDELAAVG